MRRTWLLAASLGLAALMAAPSGVVADDGDKSDPDTVEVTETKTKARIHRARELVKTLERARDLLKKDGKLDEKLAKEFAAAIEQARDMTKPITVDELTDKEKRSLSKELRKDDDGQRDDGGYMSRLQERLLSRAFDGAGLSEEQELAATTVISTWYKSSMTARTDGDSKRVSDLKRKRDADLRKMLGRRKGSKIINNINAMSGYKR